MVPMRLAQGGEIMLILEIGSSMIAAAPEPSKKPLLRLTDPPLANWMLVNNTKFCILQPMTNPKPVVFRGRALDDLRAFPVSARREGGHQLDQIQHGRDPDDWKPMTTVGPGVREIRIRDATGAFRVIYVAKFSDAVYVLHCFQKKTQKTGKIDLDLVKSRYRDLMKELGQ